MDTPATVLINDMADKRAGKKIRKH